MARLFSHGSSEPPEGWFTLQSEPAQRPAATDGAPGSRRRRGRGLVRALAPGERRDAAEQDLRPLRAPSRTSGSFTRASRLERIDVALGRALGAVVSRRYGALGLVLAGVTVAATSLALWISRPAGDGTASGRKRAHIAALTTQRDQAITATAKVRRTKAVAETNLARWRSSHPLPRHATGGSTRHRGHQRNSTGGGN